MAFNGLLGPCFDADGKLRKVPERVTRDPDKFERIVATLERKRPARFIAPDSDKLN